MITVGSLFSGIGGLDLGLERTGGFRTIWFSEIDLYASAVLKKHWPDVPNLGDITKVDWNDVRKPDMLIGGFPCQDISIAGKGRGIKEGTRSGLWLEYAKAIRFLRPKYVLIENVPMLARRGLHIVLADLASCGYDAQWFDIRASDVGAIHKRERLFIFAYSNCLRCDNWGDNQQPNIQADKKRGVEEDKQSENRWECGVNQKPDVAYSGELGQLESQSKIDPTEGREQTQYGIDGRPQIADIILKRLERHKQKTICGESSFSWCKDIRRVEDLFNRSDIPQPLIRRDDYGVPPKLYENRIRCLGNAVVPQVAEIIGEAIIEFNVKR
jgi:DNA (cytosine-5)-methyltransferase 1